MRRRMSKVTLIITQLTIQELERGALFQVLDSWQKNDMAISQQHIFVCTRREKVKGKQRAPPEFSCWFDKF